MLPFQFGHAFKAHPIDSGHKSEWYEDGSDGSQRLHHMVHAVADGGHIEIHKAAEYLALRRHGVMTWSTWLNTSLKKRIVLF